MTCDDVAAELIARFRRAGVTVERYDAERSTIHTRDHGEVNVENIHRTWLATAPAHRDAELDRFVRGILQAHDTSIPGWEEARPLLRPFVRDRMMIEELALPRDLDASKLPPFEMLGEHLVIALALDFPDAMKTVNGGELEACGVTFTEALEVAKSNLRNIESTGAWHRLGEGTFHAAPSDNWEVGRLRLPEMITALPVRGAPVALALQRDVLYVTGRDDEEALVTLAAIADEAELTRPFHSMAMVLDGDTWTTLHLPEDHPAAAALEKRRYVSLIGAYDRQKELLGPWSSREDVFVAKYQVFGDPSNPRDAFSFTACTLGIHQVLPRAERVGFVAFDEDNQPERLGVLAWNDFARLVGGDLVEMPNRWPPRYRFDGELTDGQREALKGLRLDR